MIVLCKVGGKYRYRLFSHFMKARGGEAFSELPSYRELSDLQEQNTRKQGPPLKPEIHQQ